MANRWTLLLQAIHWALAYKLITATFTPHKVKSPAPAAEFNAHKMVLQSQRIVLSDTIVDEWVDAHKITVKNTSMYCINGNRLVVRPMMMVLMKHLTMSTLLLVLLTWRPICSKCLSCGLHQWKWTISLCACDECIQQ
jgi:hypothetical protein